MRKSMQKKLNKALFATVLGTVLLSCRGALAFFGLFSIGIPVFEPTSTAAELSKNISVAITELSAEADRLKQQIANSRVAKALNFKSQFSLRLEHKPIAGAKVLQMPSVDPYNESEVKKYIYKLFLTYPSSDLPTQVKYRKMAQDFYDDSVVEAYSAAREVETYLATDVATKFAALQARLHESGGDGASSPEALNEALYNNYLAYQTIDTIARVLQESIAIKAQLEAARAINDVVEPLQYPDPDPALQGALSFGKEEIKLAKASISGTASFSGSMSIASAQAHITPKPNKDLPSVTLSNGVVVKNVTGSTIVKVNVDADKYNEDEDMYKPFEGYSTVSPGGIIKFNQSDDPTLEHPFYDARYKMNELERLEFIYDKIKIAINIHNLIKKIRLAQDDFESYRRIVALHEKARRMLQLVDKCGVTMLDNNFSDAAMVWCGAASCENMVAEYEDCPSLDFENWDKNNIAECSSDITESYSLRGGVTGWAIDQYSLARAAMSKDMTDVVINPTPAPGEDDIHVQKVENVEKEAIPYAEKHAGAILDATAQYEDEARRSQLLPWQIGAIAAKTLAENTATWGSVKKPYPVWNDQKNFYMQYLDGKYANIPIYLQYSGQTPIFLAALKAANEASMKRQIKEANVEQENAINTINENKDYDQNRKNTEIDKVKKNIADRIKQLEKEKEDNEGYIAKIAELPTDKIFPNLKEINAQEDTLLAGNLKSSIDERLLAGLSPEVAAVLRKQMNQKFKEEELPKILAERATVMGGDVGSIASSSPSVLITMSSVVSDAMAITQASQANMQAQIAALLASVCAMGDGLYGGGNKAASMHQAMLGSLASYVYEITDSDGEVLSSFTPYESVLGEASTSEDSQTFVGVKPLTARELRAPRAPQQKAFAPLREIFHFDDYDYENATPGSGKAFLGHGGEIPEIWQEILADKPFVEKEIDLEKILNSGVGTNTLLRGGQFPCNMTASLVGNEDKCVEDTIYNVDHKRECDFKKAEAEKNGGKLDEQCLRDLKCGNDYFGNAVIGGLDNRVKSMKSILANMTSTGANYGGGSVNPCVGFTLNVKETGGKADGSFFGGPLYSENAGAGFKPIADSFDPTPGRSELGIFLQVKNPGSSVQKVLNLALKASNASNLLVKSKAMSELEAYIKFASGSISAAAVGANNEAIFREELTKIYDSITEIMGKNDGDDGAMKDAGDDDDPSFVKVKKDVLGSVPFQQNQVGSFLEAYENEREYREARKRLEIQIRQLEADLAEALNNIGYQLSNAFSLLNTDDWTTSMGLLDETKNKLLVEIDTRMKNVKVKQNQIVKYRLREFNRILIGLNKDNKELVTIAEGVDSGPNFDEIIKMEEANMAVRDEYRKKEEEAFRDALRDMGRIYCANYNENAYNPQMCRFPVYER